MAGTMDGKIVGQDGHQQIHSVPIAALSTCWIGSFCLDASVWDKSIPP